MSIIKIIVMLLIATNSYSINCMPISSNKVYVEFKNYDMIVILNARTYDLNTKKGKTTKWLLQNKCLKSDKIEIVNVKGFKNNLICDIIFNGKSIIKELKDKGLIR